MAGSLHGPLPSVPGQVVTVPAHFRQEQQGATHAAARQAGFGEVQLLQEPVAAALAYGINGGTDGDTVLVFDVGGGTFDVRRGRGAVLAAGCGLAQVTLPPWCRRSRSRPCSQAAIPCSCANAPDLRAVSMPTRLHADGYHQHAFLGFATNTLSWALPCPPCLSRCLQRPAGL